MTKIISEQDNTEFVEFKICVKLTYLIFFVIFNNMNISMPGLKKNIFNSSNELLRFQKNLFYKRIKQTKYFRKV